MITQSVNRLQSRPNEWWTVLEGSNVIHLCLTKYNIDEDDILKKLVYEGWEYFDKKLGEGWKIKGTHFSKTSHYGKDLGKIGSYQFILTK